MIALLARSRHACHAIERVQSISAHFSASKSVEVRPLGSLIRAFSGCSKAAARGAPYCALRNAGVASCWSLDPFKMRISGRQGSDRVRREAAQARQPSKRRAACSADVTTATRTARRWRPFSRRCCAPTTRRWSEMKIVLGTLSAGHAIAPSRIGGSQPTFSRAWGSL